MRQLLPILLFAGCVNAPAGTDEDTTETTESALEQEYGGLDMADEAPLFDQELAFEAAAIEPDAPLADAMISDPTVAALETRTDVVRHRVLIAWGRMPADPDATTGRDWSGSLTVSRGALVVGRTVGFEDETDRVLARDRVDTVAFRSVTRPFADGLVLRVLDPDPNAGALRLRYASALDPARTFEIDLANGPISIDAGDGNRVVAIALRDRDACDHGFMRGRWLALRENLGVYRGMVANAEGDLVGHIRGIWGQRRNGEHVMFGKFIDINGRFRGILAGTYERGHVHARWIVSTGDHGLAGGVYFDAPNIRGGFFAGRWAETSCAN